MDHPENEQSEAPMGEYMPDIECLTSEELLSVILAMVAPVETDSRHECGLRYDAQRAATELYCRAVAAQQAGQAEPEQRTVWTARGA
jgi:hypothetical protein